VKILSRIVLAMVVFVLLAVLSALVALYNANKVEAQPTVLAPFMTTVTVGASATLAAVPANPSRRAMTICNGHATQTVTFTFGTLTPVSLTTGQVLAAGNVATSCFTVPPANVVGGVGAQLNLIASGASTPVTVFEY
jgi:hypothetical protein